MPDITNQILTEHNPLYSPLSPSYDDLLNYYYELDGEGNQITFEWASNEILTHRLGWVRVGLIAERVRLYRLYQKHYADWKTYCFECLGKQNWQVNKMINCAKATLEIIQAGAYVYPTCVSHVEKLLECCKKTGVHYLKAWEIVAERLPHQALITARAIGEVLGFPSEENRKINLPKPLRDRLEKVARDSDMSVEEKLEELLDMEEGYEDEETPEEIEAREQRWREDMKHLVEEHDHKIWLITALAKLINLGKRKISQFSYLRTYRANWGAT